LRALRLRHGLAPGRSRSNRLTIRRRS
jgi:hypothetical protein